METDGVVKDYLTLYLPYTCPYFNRSFRDVCLHVSLDQQYNI